MGTYVTGTGGVVRQVHDPESCVPPCPIHAPSDHHMKDWPTNWVAYFTKRGNGYMERICQHGDGHPDPDETANPPRHHMCDGCCLPSRAVAAYAPISS